MTPCELRIATRVFYKRKEAEAKEYEINLKNQYDMAIIQAWHTANWFRAKRMPDLNDVIRHSPQKEMTDEEIYKQCLKLANR